MSRKPDIRQLSLLDWEPPVIVTAYDPAQVRGNTYEFSLCRAISVTLTECGRTRPEIASEMSDILGKTVTVNMLNAYASGQREDHQISVPRFNALIGATGDMRLVEFLAAPRGWAVIERRYLKAIELAAVTE